MVNDMQDDIKAMKEHHASLQDAATQRADAEHIQNLNVLLKASYGVYDDKMKAVKRTLRPPASKAKAKAKGKAKAAA